MDIEERLRRLEEVENVSFVDISDKIKNNELTKEELMKCLQSRQMYIISNSIIKILQLNISDSTAITNIINLTKYIDKRLEFMEEIAIGHFALAALYIMKVDESIKNYNKIINEINDLEKEKVKKSIEILNNTIS